MKMQMQHKKISRTALLLLAFPIVLTFTTVASGADDDVLRKIVNYRRTLLKDEEPFKFRGSVERAIPR
jgi:hypothetical protein